MPNFGPSDSEKAKRAVEAGEELLKKLQDPEVIEKLENLDLSKLNERSPFRGGLVTMPFTPQERQSMSMWKEINKLKARLDEMEKRLDNHQG